MHNPPKTRAAAFGCRYGYTDTRFEGIPYDARHCAYRIYKHPSPMMSHQCSRRPGHGPDALYCKQHARMVED